MMKSKKYKYILTLALAHIVGISYSKDAGPVDAAMTWIYSNIIICFGLVVCLAAAVSLGNLVKSLLYHQKYLVMGDEMDAAQAIKDEMEPWHIRLYKKAWNLVPMDQETDITLGHSFDGIRELDNKLPPWWVYLFIFTVIWGGAYIYVSHYMESSQSQSEEYYAEMDVAEIAKSAFLAKQANSVDESNVLRLRDVASLESGQKVFQMHCSACHGQQGQGGIGPNLTDEYWIHGGSTVDIFKTIKYGVPEKGMVAWKAQLSPSSMQKLTSYIQSLEGTDPPNAKARQGLLYSPELTEKSTDNE